MVVAILRKESGDWVGRTPLSEARKGEGCRAKRGRFRHFFLNNAGQRSAGCRKASQQSCLLYPKVVSGLPKILTTEGSQILSLAKDTRTPPNGWVHLIPLNACNYKTIPLLRQFSQFHQNHYQFSENRNTGHIYEEILCTSKRKPK